MEYGDDLSFPYEEGPFGGADDGLFPSDLHLGELDFYDGADEINSLSGPSSPQPLALSELNDEYRLGERSLLSPSTGFEPFTPMGDDWADLPFPLPFSEEDAMQVDPVESPLPPPLPNDVVEPEGGKKKKKGEEKRNASSDPPTLTFVDGLDELRRKAMAKRLRQEEKVARQKGEPLPKRSRTEEGKEEGNGAPPLYPFPPPRPDRMDVVQASPKKKKKNPLQEEGGAPWWLSILTPQTVDQLGVSTWATEQMSALWDQITDTMHGTGRSLPDAHVLAKAAEKDPAVLRALATYGALWRMLVNVDMNGVANYMGGSIGTCVDVETLMMNTARLCVPLYGLVYMKRAKALVSTLTYSAEVREWRFWKILLEMRRRVRSNWSRASLIINNTLSSSSSREENNPTLRPYIRQRLELTPTATPAPPARIFHDEAHCFIARDEFPWPVIVASDKIGFAVTATTFVYHRLLFPIHGKRHRPANMAILSPSTNLYVLVAICDVGPGEPGLVAQAFLVDDLMVMGTNKIRQLFSYASNKTPAALEYEPTEDRRGRAVVLLRDLWLGDPNYPAQLSGRNVGRSLPSNPRLPVVPVSLMATKSTIALAYPDGMMHFRWSVPERAEFYAKGGGNIHLETARYVPWGAFAAVLGNDAANSVLQPIPQGVPIISVPADLYGAGRVPVAHVPDDAFYCPLRPGTPQEAWVDLPMLSAVPCQARETAILTLWRQQEERRNHLPFALARNRYDMPWDSLGMSGAIAGLVVRFYEPEGENVDGLQNVTPEVRAKLLTAPPRGFRIDNPDMPFMQANVAGVAYLTDDRGLAGGGHLRVTLLPWASIRAPVPENYEHILRSNLMIYPEHSLPRTRATWFFETDAITFLQCVPDLNMLRPEELPGNPRYGSGFFTACMRTVLIGEYAKGRPVVDGEHTRIISHNVFYGRHQVTPEDLLTSVNFSMAYSKGNLIVLARREAQRARQVHLACLYLTVLEGPPYRAHLSDAESPKLRKILEQKKNYKPFILTSSHL